MEDGVYNLTTDCKLKVNVIFFLNPKIYGKFKCRSTGSLWDPLLVVQLEGCFIFHSKYSRLQNKAEAENPDSLHGQLPTFLSSLRYEIQNLS